jgi:hypothetical protein
LQTGLKKQSGTFAALAQLLPVRVRLKSLSRFRINLMLDNLGVLSILPPENRPARSLNLHRLGKDAL